MRSFSRNIGLVTVVPFFLLLSILPSQLPAQIIVQEIEGHQDTSSWALHDSGRIFAAVKSTDSVIEYDLSGDEVRNYSVGSEPTEMIVKGDHLVVACVKSSSFSVIDLKANKVTGKIPLAGKGPYALFCSKVDNGLVYGISNTGDAWWDGEVFQADLKTMKVRKRVKVRGWGQSHAVHVAMSADGNWIIPDARGQSSPSGADLMRVDESECTFTQIRDHHSSFGQIEAGPANRYWTLGSKLYPLDMKASVRNFSGTPVAIHPVYDLVASFTPSSLNFDKFSDAKSLKKQPMQFTSEDSKKKSGSRRSRRNQPFAKSEVLVGFDASGSHAIAAAGKYCRIVDLEDLDIPLRPLLMIDVPTVVETKVGGSIKIPLSLTNSKLDSKTTFALENGPKGVKLSGNQIIWTPTAKDIGRHTLKVSAKLDDSLDQVTIDLNVKATKMELNFSIAGIDVDKDGKYAIAWGKKIIKGRNGRIQSQDSGSDEVAILDLVSQKVVIQKPLATGVQSAIIQQPYAFLVPRSGNVLFRFDAKTLGSSKRMFLKDKCIGVTTFVKNQICTICGSHNYTLNVIDPETMKSTKTKTMVYNPHVRNALQNIREASPEQIDFQSKLLDKKTGLVTRMEKNPGLKSLVNVNDPNVSQSHQMRELPRKMYGRYLTRNALVSATGSMISQFNNKTVYATPHHPVGFATRSESQSNGRNRETKTYIEMLSLVDGEVLDSRVFDVSDGHQRHNMHRYSKNFFPFKEKIILVKGNELFSIPIEPSTIKSAPLPLHFPIATIPELAIDKPEILNFKAVGGKGKIEYQLVADYEGISVESATGKVTIDTPLLWKNYLKTSTSSAGSRSSMMRSRSNNNNSNKLSAKDFEAFFGKPLPDDKLAFVLPIHLAATDEEAQEDRLSVYALVFGDKAAVDKIENEKRAKMEVARKAALERQAAAREKARMAEAERTARAQTQTSNTEAGSARMDKLENRMRRMEATLDSILQKLDKLESAQGDK